MFSFQYKQSQQDSEHVESTNPFEEPISQDENNPFFEEVAASSSANQKSPPVDQVPI